MAVPSRGGGFPERRGGPEVRQWAPQGGPHPAPTVNKITFSEQCYYVFGDLSGGCESCECPCPGPTRVALVALSCVSSSGLAQKPSRGCCAR